ncbi:MAG: alpha/beta hydrolase [Dermatophilaceae bacterium]
MAHPSASSYADVNGVHLYFERHGQGDPLVLIHGGLMTIPLSWARLIPVLATDHAIIAVELQGHGRTTDIDRDFNPANNAADIAALLDHLGIDRAAIIGHSTGAATALEMAVNHPGKVTKCVALSASVKPDAMVPEMADLDQLAASGRMPTPDEIAAMQADYERLSSTPENFEAFQQKIASADDSSGWSDQALAGIACPVLVVLGDHDFVQLGHLTQVQQLIPDSQVGVLPGTTHTQVPTRIDLLAPMLSAFL